MFNRSFVCCGAAISLAAASVGWAASAPAPPPSVCIGSKCATTAPPATAIKWNPGIYLYYGDDGGFTTPSTVASKQAADFAAFDSYGSNPNVTGFAVLFEWSTLEGATAGDYSAGFALIDAYLAHLAAEPNPKKLILEIWPYQLGNCNGTDPHAWSAYPAYMQSNVNTGSSSYIDDCFQTARLSQIAFWNPAAMNRAIALSAAYAARYNSNPNFEMFQPWEETAEFAGNTSAGYTPSGAVSELVAFYTAAKSQWTNTLVRYPANDPVGGWSDSQQSSEFKQVIAAYNNGRGLIVGGPDTIPEPPVGNFPIMANYVFRGLNSPWANGAAQNSPLAGSPNSAYTNYQATSVAVPWVSEVEAPDECEPAQSFYCAVPVSSTLINTGAYASGTMKASFYILYAGSWLPLGVQPANIISLISAGTFPTQAAYPKGW